MFMDKDIKGYSQWFAGMLNNMADALSWDWHLSANELTFLLHCHFPQQTPTHFEISPLPKEISYWLILLLQQLPVNSILAALERILPLCWLHQLLPQQSLQARTNPHAWSICHGC
jgi:hypothetical protein